jgi:anti-sigma regulatory factor (Ser/Thr protein kinase)
MLKTAVAEATMNAIEHRNDNRPDLAIDIEVFCSGTEIIVTITDHGGRGGPGWATRRRRGDPRPRPQAQWQQPRESTARSG